MLYDRSTDTLCPTPDAFRRLLCVSFAISLSLSLSLSLEREREREREKERKLANWLVDIGICRCRVMKYSRPFSLLFFHRLPLHRCPYFATSSSCFSLFRLLREGKGSERVIRITYYPKTALAKGLQGLDVSIYERCSRDATRRWGPLSTIYGSTEFELCNYPRFRLGDALYAERDEKHNRTFVISNRRMNISRRILDFRKMDDVKLILFVSSLQKKRIPTYIYIYIPLSFVLTIVLELSFENSRVKFSDNNIPNGIPLWKLVAK